MLDTVQFMQKNRFITDKAQEQACYFGVFVGMSIFVLWWPLIGRGGRLKRAQGVLIGWGTNMFFIKRADCLWNTQWWDRAFTLNDYVRR